MTGQIAVHTTFSLVHGNENVASFWTTNMCFTCVLDSCLMVGIVGPLLQSLRLTNNILITFSTVHGSENAVFKASKHVLYNVSSIPTSWLEFYSL
jgi:hypothetical protein